MNFIKMQGLGNDFILVDARQENLSEIDVSTLAVDVCDRHFGIGGDGLLVILPSDKADVKMQIFNSDGSEPEMCGNGIRCFAKYVYESSSEKKEIFSVETKAGVLVPAVIINNGIVVAVEVDMGAPKILGDIELYGIRFSEISMGNPHAIAFVDDFSKISIIELGPKIENDTHFPYRTNVEFVKVLGDQEIEIKVWERGAGETLACGTGACAAVAAAILSGKTKRRVLVHLPGGNLDIEWPEDNASIVMRGPAEKVFEGRYFY
ncbi:hypothetical protein A2526_05930 [candidate division WOR-1 bacterium RIFOXYD2_FULL_36_8]|uniref:Diaminopimelate epimerase n=1 Tax=candidate division WOR-1 bacterium RIFOXYB2_FULL_36_35 TaxID=1802578 RepID=A0A1F4RYP8_UNCSA|nr:MAG: hypothetical protein A2230_08735 [candidate division WOR-1 bacterium RIFOXYA2_FULL_36_21]OGC13308.1 MAG: hypothetical protein A2290_08180 [candidate division WOR-1 bacterium RIFOXYB2_FULL_36_35]OGC16621.1 MAG: hypothetical protein A2282_02590 [candidate division WOR-1 bacterium RIFOXYA12_FULL_36_13]OGC37470.1 MAG: hypothetical protein A2526_05930 [candidate division WOR-1 bacterium RIFOXYD2_FULL_36_8]